MNCAHCGDLITDPRRHRFCSDACGYRAASRRAYVRHRAKIVAARAARRERDKPAFLARAREYSRRWRTAHPNRNRSPKKRDRAQQIAYMRAYNARPDIKARRRARDERLRDQLRTDAKRYRETHRDRMRQLYHRGAHRRRARKRGAESERVDRIVVFQRARWRCQLCGCRTPKRLMGTLRPTAPTLDHIVALAAGGTHTYRNVQCACWSCNTDKRTRALGQPSLF